MSYREIFNSCVGYRTDEVGLQEQHFAWVLKTGVLSVADMYVYYFARIAPTGGRVVSKRRATLEAIKRLGEAVMESQWVVDHTEVDGNGFLIGNADSDRHPMDALWSQIRSLEQRAKSRDNEVLELSEDPDSTGRYMLYMESRELRKQAELLRSERAQIMAAGRSEPAGVRVPDFGPFLGSA